MRNDDYINSRKDIRNKRYKNRRRQVMMNRVILLGILIILIMVLIILGIKSCRENEETPTPINDNNGNVEKDSGNEEKNTPEQNTGDDISQSYLTDGKRIICIDPGHGGNDGGSGDESTSLEKDDNIKMSKALKSELEKLGITVYMTRENDEFLNLEERTKIANSTNADLVVSIHRNEYKSDSNVKGFEAWVHSSKPEDSASAATKIQEALVEAGITKDRGVKYGAQSSPSDNYYLNSNSKGPCCILEMGFMTNAEDNAVFRNKTSELAESMAKAIESWLDTQGL